MRMGFPLSRVVVAQRSVSFWLKRGKQSEMRLPAVLVILIATLTACAGKKPEQRPVTIPVTVATVAQKDVPIEINVIGNVESITSVQVKSMINGEITSLGFKEGQDVRKGDLLFTIDPRPFEADLLNREATLARDIATAENARVQAKRYQALLQAGVVAPEQAEQMQTAADTAEAVVRADRAAVENSRVQLQYTKIYSPINGRTGNLTIQLGNVIKANDLSLITINQISPMYVAFTIPEQNLGEVKHHMAQHALSVAAKLPNDTVPARGTLTFVDNTVDRQTGTIKLKGTFENTDRRLWPGQYVNVTLTLATQPNAVVVPSVAVQEGQQGQFVYIVNKEMKAESRPVRIARTIGDQSIVGAGIEPGETVVTDGQLRITPGVKVEFKNARPGQGQNAAAEKPQSLS